MRNGFTFPHWISWDPYNEAEDLIRQAKKYKQEYGYYPERIYADRIYINTMNHNCCIRNNIRLSSKRLDRSPKNPGISAAQKKRLSADQRRRNEVEGRLGQGRRKYSLDLTMARLGKGVEKIRRLLRLFYGTIFAWIYACPVSISKVVRL